MNMTRRALLLGLAAGICCAGCVSYHTPPMDRRVTVAPELGTAIWVTDVRLTRAQSQHLTMQANVVNNTSGVVQMEYKTVWLDAAGAQIDSIVSSWQPMSAAPRDVVGLTATAPGPEAVDFRFYVQAAHGSR